SGKVSLGFFQRCLVFGFGLAVFGTGYFRPSLVALDSGPFERLPRIVALLPGPLQVSRVLLRFFTDVLAELGRGRDQCRRTFASGSRVARLQIRFGRDINLRLAAAADENGGRAYLE